MKPETKMNISVGRKVISIRSDKNAVRDSGQNSKQKHIGRIGVWVNALLLGIVMGSPVYSATMETKVGVTAASVTNAVGKPPISPARDLDTGLEVFFNEKITTNASGRAQLLFRDGTSLTVGSSSEMTIDEYVFDPDTDTGELVINISKGVFRLVGGKISKNTPVVFNTKTATVAVRGGIATLNVSSTGALQANFIYGDFMVVTTTNTGATSTTSQAGWTLDVNAGQRTAPTKTKTNPEALAQDLAALEKSVDNTPTPTDEPASNTGNAETGTTQTQENVSESKPDAVVEVAATTTKPEEADSPPTEPGADAEVATVGLQVDSEAIPAEPGDAGELLAGQVGDQVLVTKAQPDRDEPPVIADSKDTIPADPANLSSDPSTVAGLPAGQITVSKGVPAPDMGTKLDINVLVVDLGRDVSTHVPPLGSPLGGNPSATSGGSGMTLDNIALVVDAITKAPGVKTDEGKPVTNPIQPDEIIDATNPIPKPGKKPDKPKPDKPPVDPCDPAKEKCDGGEELPVDPPCPSMHACEEEEELPVDPPCPSMHACEEEEEPPVDPPCPSMHACEEEEEPPIEEWSLGKKPLRENSQSKRDRSMAMIYHEGSRLHISSTVTTNGAMLVLSSDYRHLCRVCSYLEWHRDVLWPTGRKPDMASIRYWLSGVSTTQAELAAAASKTAQYSGGLFGNVSTVGHITEKFGHFDAKVRFGVSHYQIQNFNAAFDGRNYLGNSAITPNNAVFSAIGSSGERQMNAQGYFFGNPVRGAPPPEIGGHFQITGGGYDAGGIFAGARH